jgi:GNAT superfamily N-acetyltransferase
MSPHTPTDKPESKKNCAPLIVDNFFANADAIREAAIGAHYIDWDAPDGETYRRICITQIPGLQEGIEKALGPVTMLGMGYRLNFGGEMPNAAIHSDVGWGTHAAVVYLSNGPGGTAFWRHKSTGARCLVVGDTTLQQKVQSDWNNLTAWEQIDLCPMRFNRCVIYSSELFHSRWPFEAFGSDPDTGRLIAVAFFTPRKPVDVRKATEADIPGIVAMAEKFYATTSFAAWAPFNSNTIENLASALTRDHVVLVAESDDKLVGMVGLFVAPFIFNRDVNAACEVVWWVEPNAQGHGIGKALLAAIEPACRTRGCKSIQMIHLASSPPQAAAIYERAGFRHTETSYMKIVP